MQRLGIRNSTAIRLHIVPMAVRGTGSRRPRPLHLTPLDAGRLACLSLFTFLSPFFCPPTATCTTTCYYSRHRDSAPAVRARIHQVRHSHRWAGDTPDGLPVPPLLPAPQPANWSVRAGRGKRVKCLLVGFILLFVCLQSYVESVGDVLRTLTEDGGSTSGR